MSDILIRNMEMPTTCGKCQIKNAIECNRWKLVRSVVLDRHRDCPLFSVPSHGRLGDLDELYAHLNEWYLTNRSGMSPTESMYIRAMLAGIAEAPTILEAASLPVLHGTFAASSKEEATRRLTDEEET